MPADDAEARRKRAEELRRAIDEAAGGRKRPASPREFTDERAREAAKAREVAKQRPQAETPEEEEEED